MKLSHTSFTSSKQPLEPSGGKNEQKAITPSPHNFKSLLNSSPPYNTPRQRTSFAGVVPLKQSIKGYFQLISSPCSFAIFHEHTPHPDLMQSIKEHLEENPRHQRWCQKIKI